MLKGYRLDDLQDQRWVYRSTSYSDHPAVSDVPIELD
jgi:hypothetical protein